MLAPVQEIQDLEDLRTYVNNVLCYYNQLEVDAFRMTQRLLMRGGKPCGMFFCVHGPRSTQFTAVWETDRNTVLFYDSLGERFHKTQLVDAPQLELCTA